MMVVGPTGVGKSTLLNSLLCPAKWTNDYDDCHFQTGRGSSSVTKNISNVVGAWLGDTEASNFVKVYDTAGLGDSDGLSDTETLKGIVEVINSEPVQTILLVFKAVNRFSQHIQKQLRTLQYILGEQLWDHVITVYTFWGFSTGDKKDRERDCIKEKKDDFDRDITKTRNHCEQVNFENEKVEEMAEGFKKYLNVTKRLPYAFPHPVFNYDDEEEKRIFFENAMKIYNNAKTMSPLHCDAECQRRLEIALKSESGSPFVLGRNLQKFDAEEEILLVCHVYLGLGKSTKKEVRWWHNSSLLKSEDIQRRNILVEDEILLDVIKQSLLIIPNAIFDEAGAYKCSTIENQDMIQSLEVTVKVLPRKYM